jgi:hypothetical protein
MDADRRCSALTKALKRRRLKPFVVQAAIAGTWWRATLSFRLARDLQSPRKPFVPFDEDLEDMIDVPRSRSRRRRRAPKPDNSPSPEMIREMTEQIRKNWTPRELHRRSNTARHMQVMQMPLEPRRKGFWGD